MNPDKLRLLWDELDNIDKAADYLKASLMRSRELLGRAVEHAEDLERLESLSSRFARLADLLIQRVLRLIDELELVTGGTLLDRIYRAEKRGLVKSAQQLILIRELRNLIAHEYAAERISEIHIGVARLAPELLEIVPKIRSYINDLKLRFGSGNDPQHR